MRIIAQMLAAVLLLVGVASGAQAAVKNKTFDGLFVRDGDDAILGEISRTDDWINRVYKDTSASDGDQMRIKPYFRDRKPKNGKGVHVSVDWKKYARNCGLSGIEIHVSGGGGSISCDVSWKDNGDYESNNVSDGAWYYVQPKKYFNGTDSTLRGGVHICQAQWNADPCSGKRWVTTFWN